ncbi:MAG: caspase family protein [Brumimicrobium sp.]|nr:caspase family protein [Brumimicrobium sp.]
MKFLLVFFTLAASLLAICQDAKVVLTQGHTDQINAIDVSPNERWMASGSNNKIVKIWDIPSSREFTTLGPNDGRINSLNFTPDNKLIAALINHGSIKVWNFVTNELVVEVPADYNASGIEFSDDSRWMYYINENGYASRVKLQKESKGEVLTDQYAFHLNKIPKTSKLTLLDHKGKLHILDIETKEKSTLTLFDEFNFPFCPSKISASGNYFYSGFNDDHVHIFDLSTGKKKWSIPVSSKIQGVHFDEDNELIYITVHGKKLQIYNLKTETFTTLEENEPFSPTHFTVFHNNEILATVHMKEIVFYNLKDLQPIKKFQPLISKMYNMTVSPNGDYLVAANGKLNLAVWNLKQNKIERTLDGMFPCQFGTDGKLYAVNRTLQIGIWNLESGEMVKQMEAGGEILQALTVSFDGKYLAGAGYQGKIRIWDLKDQKLIKTFQAHQGGIADLNFSPDGKRLASCGYDANVRVWDWEKEKELVALTEQATMTSGVAFSPDGKYLASSAWDKTVYIRDAKTYDSITAFTAHQNTINSIAFSSDSKYLASGSTNNSVWEADNSVKLWEVPTGKLVCTFEGHLDGVNKVVFEPQTHRVYSCSNDGTLKLWNPDLCGVEATFTAAVGTDYIIFNKDYYYTGTKAALEGIAFKIDDRLYPFEQFDLIYNRPDIVAKTIGKTPENLIRAYEYIYQKRIKKMGFKKGDLDGGFVVPQIIIDRDKLPYISEENEVTFTVTARDSVEILDRIQVYLNGVPYFGNEGISLKEKNIHSIEKDITIGLIQGMNKITVMSVNRAGAYSLKESFKVIHEPKNLLKSNLYVIGIGVSEYQNEKYNLTYPTKDVNDFVDQMKQNSEIYKNIYIKTLTNEEATQQNISELERFLSEANINDVVVIFIAGHGVLDEDYNYYFGTYDMDFLNPAEKGLAYESIEHLLTQVKAIKKLLIMDTCHSGEVDKDEIIKDTSPIKEDEDIKFRSVATGYKEEDAFGLENSREMVENLFSDIRQGSGATVISSAGGAEFAMESDQWKNGLFTYCMLEGIKSGKADLNGDTKIEVDELRKYVYENVKELSNGKQRPTTRIENIQMNYPVYYR